MHIYAFGSICRGEIDKGSDIDILACIETGSMFEPIPSISTYDYRSLKELWQRGNPFSWHLHCESQMVFSSDGSDFLKNLGRPAPYKGFLSDLKKFSDLFETSRLKIKTTNENIIFNISCIYLATRNLAICYSLHIGKPHFSRKASQNIDIKLALPDEVHTYLMRARLLSSRGHGVILTKVEIDATIKGLDIVENWILKLKESANET